MYAHIHIYIYIYIYLTLHFELDRFRDAHQQDKSLGLLREYGQIVVAHGGSRREVVR